MIDGLVSDNRGLVSKSASDQHLDEGVEASSVTFFRGEQPSDSSLEHKQDIAFEGVSSIDLDTDLWFKLHGDSLNPLIDAATPLFGLILRTRDLQTIDDIHRLYGRVHGDIAAISEDIRHRGYEGVVQVAYRYCLCSFIDEAIMLTPWGAQSVWAERSMLSIFHEETWGGEKFFTILARMLMEPENYREILEFLYYCLVLGFKGKYGVVQDGERELSAIIEKLHRVLRELRGERPDELINTSSNINASRYKLARQVPLWSIWLGLLLVLAVVYLIYSYNLSEITDNVLKQLDLILQE